MIYGTEEKHPGKRGDKMGNTLRKLKKIFKDKHILITGQTGFKGSWLSIWLNMLGAKVVGYALDPYTQRDNFVLSNISRSIVDIRGDIRDYDKLNRIFKEYSPEFVFHLAAQSLVREGYERPKETYDINIGGTVNILENCRKNKNVKVVIIVTSDKCYENKEWIWGYREIDAMGGYDPYSSSKACAELVTSAYLNSFFNPKEIKLHGKGLASARAGNVIGGGDWAKDRLIPDCIRALENKESIKVRNPDSTRPWQYVLEPLGGYLLLATKLANEPARFSGAWNFGPNSYSIVKVSKIIELVIKFWGAGTWKNIHKPSTPHEAGMLSLDISKARFQLGWNPCLNLSETLESTIEWYKQSQNRSNIPNFCKTEIIKYMKKMQINE